MTSHETMMQMIRSNMHEIITKCPNTYAAHVASTTLRAIDKHGAPDEDVKALMCLKARQRMIDRKSSITPEILAGFADKPEVSGDLS